MYNVLSIDGGGVWGLGVARFILEYEKCTGQKFADKFEAFSGTSTGAVIAALLCEGFTGEQIYKLYKDNLKHIFSAPWYYKINPFVPKYDNTYLANLLRDNLHGNISEFTKPIFIPVSCSFGDQEKVFDRGDLNFSKWKAVLCSTSAPSRFYPIDNMYMDGGLFLNNPCAALQAGLVGTELDKNYRMLSLGTGGSTIGRKLDPNMTIIGWGKYLATEWLAKAGESGSYIVKKNIGAHNFMRLKPILTDATNYSMDNVSKMDDIENIWLDVFNESIERLNTFIG